MKRNLILTLVVTAAMALSAFNTVKGAGKDLESASDATKDAINK